MPLDALCLSGVVYELEAALIGAKIDKIHQPSRDEVVLALRGLRGNVKLLLSANPSRPRAQLTEIARENPDAPPMFCMLLRKHLSNARILGITQPPMERVVDIRLEALDELGDKVERHLILEAMGRHSNLILSDAQGRILDCLRRVDAEMSEKRQVLPGLFYHLPPVQDKLDPSQQTRQELEGLLALAPEEIQASQWLLDTFGGLSPLICRELAQRAGDSADVRVQSLGEAGRRGLLDQLEALFVQVSQHNYVPTMIVINGKPKDFTFTAVTQYGETAQLIACPSFSHLLDQFYEKREQLERVRQKGLDLIRAVTNARDRVARKLGNQEKELTATQNRERLRQFGDMITSNFYAMEKGMARLETADYYDPDCAVVEIPLDVLLTPQQNAARYYKEYNKAKTAQEMLIIQLEKGRHELEYLNSVLEHIGLAEGERDLQEIRQEMTDTGYFTRKGKGKERVKRISAKPMEFRSSTGLRISVGKNNTQNDLLTCKQAYKSDIWLHTQKIHGSHVILWTEGAPPDLQSLNEAASLAAWFSQGRDGGKVPVDYTPVKYVKKPAGARPGMVVYTVYETAWVTPQESLVKTLRMK